MENRHEYIGASECAAILGMSPYQTQLDVWNAKVNKEVIPDNDSMYWGRVLEDVVGAEFAKRNNVTLAEPQKEFRRGNVRCHLDFVVKEWNCPLEIKTTSAFTAPWLNGVPHHYYIQCQMQMFLSGAATCHVALLKGGNDYSEHIVKAMPTDQAESMYQAMESWWEAYVMPKVRPPITELDEVNKLFDRAKDKTTKQIGMDEQSKSILNSIEALAQLKDHDKSIKEAIQDEESIIKAYMGEHDSLLNHSGETVVTWKNVNRRPKVDWPAAIEAEVGNEIKQQWEDKHKQEQKSYRVFKLLQPKK